MKTLLLASFLSFSLWASDYPAHWWKPVDRSIAYSWEILPQDAKPGEVILSKRNELGMLSNFASTPFKLDGITYPSLEGFWQMMKFPEGKRDERRQSGEWKFTRKEVSQMTGRQAKKAGSHASAIMKELNINWVTYKKQKMTYRTSEKGDHYELIRRATWAKVNQNPKVKEILLKTGDLILKADHKVSPNDPPAWKYYQIYMEIRDRLNNE